MLDEKIIEKLSERLVNRIQQGNEYILKIIGESIKKIGTLSPSKAQQLAQILKYGGNYNKILNELARITDLNVKDIEKIFEEVAKENYLFAKQFYNYRNVEYIPYEKNISLQRQVKALADITAKEYMNICNTRALGFIVKDIYGNNKFVGLAEQYQKAIDEAVLNVAQGKDTFQNQMYKTIKEMGTSGIKTVDYESGYTRRLDSSVRMNMQRALTNLSNTLQKQFGEEYGADGVEISVHINPAPDHAKAQGRQFSKEEYATLQRYGTAKDYTGKTIDLHMHSDDFRPIGEYNCYHTEFSIVLGVNKPEYTDKQLQEIIDNNNKGFEIDGKHYTMYEGTQMQRRLETAIRKQKDVQILAKESNNKELIQESQQKITELTNKYKELSETSGIQTKMQRMRVSGYKRMNVSR